MSALRATAATGVLVIGTACAGSCWPRQEVWPGPQVPPQSSAAAAPASEFTGDSGLLSVDARLGAHPRILLTSDRLAAVRGLRDAAAPSWLKLSARCDEVTRARIPAGYEAWDWGNAALDLALCYAVTRRTDYATSAIVYLRALLDDRHTVGDGAGGDDAVHHDQGYSIRTRGCLAAIAYDWLHDAPGMTPDLRKHALDRFVTWTGWFAESGYNRDQPISNYYVGWFGAVAFGGIAADGDDPRATELLRGARRMFSAEVVPAYRRLAGGDFPEGWQYGDLVGAILGMFADAESRAGAARTPGGELPWLRESVSYRAHALWPDGKHMLDTGDWSAKPAVAPAHALMVLSVLLPSSESAARYARALARLAADPSEDWLWLSAIADDPSRVAEDPRRGATSYFAQGTSSLTARSDWSDGGVWVAMVSAPSLSDHQHLDAGHFEIVRGADALVVDGGGYGSYSSLSHNVIAVDDGKENDTYAPSQGTWSDTAAISRSDQTDRYVYGLADYASAYNPAGYPREHSQRSVSRAEREMLFSRGPWGAASETARIVVYDRLTLSKPTYAATFLLHGGALPEVRDDSVRFVVGKSAAFATTLVPAHATPLLVKEPTDLGQGPYYTNRPPEGISSVRVEVRSPIGSAERRFLHAIVVGPRDFRSPPAVAIAGEGAEGAAIDDEAYVFASAAVQRTPATLAYRAPGSARRHFVASLAPEGHYEVSAEGARDGCQISLRPGEGRVASRAGVLVIDVAPGCTLR